MGKETDLSSYCSILHDKSRFFICRKCEIYFLYVCFSMPKIIWRHRGNTDQIHNESYVVAIT